MHRAFVFAVMLLVAATAGGVSTLSSPTPAYAQPLCILDSQTAGERRTVCHYNCGNGQVVNRIPGALGVCQMTVRGEGLIESEEQILSRLRAGSSETPVFASPTPSAPPPAPPQQPKRGLAFWAAVLGAAAQGASTPPPGFSAPSVRPGPTGSMLCQQTREEISGFNRICYYGCMSGQVVQTVPQTTLCPLSIRG